MNDIFTEDDVVMIISRLTHRRLVQFIADDYVKPRRDAGRYVFGPIDVARLELLCDLCFDLDLDDITLGVVISLIDQLHAVRQELATVAHVIDRLPVDLRRQIEMEIKQV